MLNDVQKEGLKFFWILLTIPNCPVEMGSYRFYLVIQLAWPSFTFQIYGSTGNLLQILLHAMCHSDFQNRIPLKWTYWWIDFCHGHEHLLLQIDFSNVDIYFFSSKSFMPLCQSIIRFSDMFTRHNFVCLFLRLPQHWCLLHSSSNHAWHLLLYQQCQVHFHMRQPLQEQKYQWNLHILPMCVFF